jgi:Arc/MetJ family transcription regulator
VTIVRKSHNLDARLLARAKKVLGVGTETEAIHEALESVLVGEEVMRDLDAVRGKNGRGARGIFRPDFVRKMRAELPTRPPGSKLRSGR